jgi:hypothetical protein
MPPVWPVANVDARHSGQVDRMKARLSEHYGQVRAVPCGMTTPAVEERIMDLVPEDAKVVLLLARKLRTRSARRSTGSRAGSPDALRSCRASAWTRAAASLLVVTATRAGDRTGGWFITRTSPGRSHRADHAIPLPRGTAAREVDAAGRRAVFCSDQRAASLALNVQCD